MKKGVLLAVATLLVGANVHAAENIEPEWVENMFHCVGNFPETSEADPYAGIWSGYWEGVDLGGIAVYPSNEAGVREVIYGYANDGTCVLVTTHHSEGDMTLTFDSGPVVEYTFLPDARLSAEFYRAPDVQDPFTADMVRIDIN